MPVTAKLSRRFYEHFGDEITNELVDWMNSVDATYQSTLRELNELNFARFDAKLAQRVASVENRIETVETRLTARIDGVEQRFDARIDGLEQRLDARIDGVEQRLDARIDGVEQRLEAKIEGVEQRLEAKIEGVEQRLEAKIEGVEERLLARIEEVEGRLGGILAALGQRIEGCVTKSEFADRLAASESRMIRWMVGLWTTSTLATIGLLVTVLRTR